jgi:hypothetical protein
VSPDAKIFHSLEWFNYEFLIILSNAVTSCDN